MTTPSSSEIEIDERYLAELLEEFPKLRVIDKSHDAFSKMLDRFLRVVTLGGQSAYMTRYVTTIGQRVYVPSSWSRRSAASRTVTLRHEAVHLRQFRRFGFVGMSIVYLLPFFPLGLAYGRARLEWEAYEETIRATAELFGVEKASDPDFHEGIVRQFVGPAYGWMWPFRGQVEGWVSRVVADLER